MRSDIRRNFPVYNRGPWSSAGHWITAALEDELQLMQLRPDIAIEVHGLLDESIEESFPEARKYFTAMLREVPAVTDDPWSAGPLYLSHADLAPPNIFIEPAGPNAGAITAVVDWEMASMVPLLGLPCYPQWFRKEVSWCNRDEATARALEEAYASEMRHLGHREEVIRLIKKDECRRGFIEIAVQPWLAADLAEDWLKDSGRRHCTDSGGGLVLGGSWGQIQKKSRDVTRTPSNCSCDSSSIPAASDLFMPQFVPEAREPASIQ
ncbi:hypothetical protein CERSUDRAFT_95959 [Gelatoporia subvermispora B]|uniref:Aminoglycoside phosphotransferase domain-containing protein n=1 Tax=Ceriporiopsis subvermispora (strain B) TaxID=914234 RepID=M2QUH5_CERS8|nr:hypothetical protein CERSUDRAFT_95959 [Gelatoporia subvermispora B]